MQPFHTLQGIAAPFQRINIDTDLIIPKQFLKTIQRTGLGKHLFEEVRYNDHGQENPSFILNQPDFRRASILIAGDNLAVGLRGNMRLGPCWILAFAASSPPVLRIFFITTALKTAFCPSFCQMRRFKV